MFDDENKIDPDEREQENSYAGRLARGFNETSSTEHISMGKAQRLDQYAFEM